ncbi:MAG TPA: MFS transporter [Myxococcaceae bacterium]|nr:MFS transporter [Myxococcaceae bacterium]
MKRNAADASPTPAGRREWIGLAVLALPCLLYSMDLTVLNLALPRLSADLAPSSSELLWIVDIYGFLVAGLLIVMGNLGDRIGRRRLLLMGAAAFGLASVLAAFSKSTGMLIAARAVLGVAGATIAPSTLSLIRNMFLDPRQRTVAIGVWVSSYSVGGAIGPVLGGVMLQHFWWGSVFLVGVPVMALLLVTGPVLLPEYRDATARPLDGWSAVLSLLAVLSVIFGVKQVAQEGLNALGLVTLAAGVGMGIAFARRQRRLADPLIDLELFREPAFGASLGTYLLGTMVAFGSFVFVGQYLQLVLGLSPLQAGLRTLPWSLGFILSSMLVPPLARHIRPAYLMAAGLLVAAVGFGMLSQLHALSLWGLVASMLLTSVGLAPVFTLATDLIVGAAPPARAGAASAISETSSELGGALGIAILGSIGTALYRGSMRSVLVVGATSEAQAAALDTLGGATAAAEGLPEVAGRELLQAARTAFAHATEWTLILCTAIALATAALTVFTLRRVQPRADGEPAAGSPSAVEH